LRRHLPSGQIDLRFQCRDLGASLAYPQLERLRIDVDQRLAPFHSLVVRHVQRDDAPADFGRHAGAVREEMRVVRARTSIEHVERQTARPTAATISRPKAPGRFIATVRLR
jgi:hypothetical protein